LVFHLTAQGRRFLFVPVAGEHEYLVKEAIALFMAQAVELPIPDVLDLIALSIFLRAESF